MARTSRPTHHHRPERVYTLARLAYCSCGLRLRGETLVRKGRKEYRYYRCPGRRDGRCDSSNVPAATVEQAVVEHIAGHFTPPDVLDQMRDELRRMRHVPDEGLRAKRQRLDTALKRLGDRYTWQEIDETEYKAQRREVEQQIASLPLPVESNVIAFDRAATELLPFAEVIRETTAEHQRAIVGHIVEKVTITDREVTDIVVRLEARPFFSDLAEGEADVWRWRPRTDSNRRRAP
jgi:hypothetical protein